MSKSQAPLMDEAFNRWWHDEGRGMSLLPGHDLEEHAHRIARIAWHNGAYTSLARFTRNEALPTRSEHEKE